MRLINADELIEKLESNAWNIDEWELPHEQVSAGLTANAYDRETVENMPTIDAESHWIPCSERLPDDDRSKVVTLANGNTECGYYANGDWWCIGDTITLENPTVIAWMPLPKPYEVKE